MVVFIFFVDLKSSIAVDVIQFFGTDQQDTEKAEEVRQSNNESGII